MRPNKVGADNSAPRFGLVAFLFFLVSIAVGTALTGAVSDLIRLGHFTPLPIMTFIKKIKATVTKYTVGELLVDLGTMTIDKHGRDMSLSIRQFAGKPPHLSFKFYSNGAYEWITADCSNALADQLERAAQEMRKHTP